MDLFDLNGCFTCNTYIKIPTDRYYIAKVPNEKKSYYLCPRCFSIASTKWDFSNPAGLTTGMVYQYVNNYISQHQQQNGTQQPHENYSQGNFVREQRLAHLENIVDNLQKSTPRLQSFPANIPAHHDYNNEYFGDPTHLINQAGDVKTILSSNTRNISKELSKLERNLLETNVTSRVSKTLNQIFDQIQRTMLAMEIDVEHLIAEANEICERTNAVAQQYHKHNANSLSPHYQRMYNEVKSYHVPVNQERRTGPIDYGRYTKNNYGQNNW